MGKTILFESWHSWKVCFLSGVKKTAWGIGRIVTCIILGIISIIVWLWRCAVNCVKQNPQIALCAFLIVVFLVWLVMYASSKAERLGAEEQRDSIAWQYQEFKQLHGYE